LFASSKQHMAVASGRIQKKTLLLGDRSDLTITDLTGIAMSFSEAHQPARDISSDEVFPKYSDPSGLLDLLELGIDPNDEIETTASSARRLLETIPHEQLERLIEQGLRQIVGLFECGCNSAASAAGAESERRNLRLRVLVGFIGAAMARQATLFADGNVEPGMAPNRDRHLREGSHKRADVAVSPHLRDIVGQSLSLRKVFSDIEQVAPMDSTVLLIGETGTGKELVASAVHNLSTRRHKPMVRVNCAAIPPSLLESELFGREKGAYTGALAKQIGRFEMAHGSTIFLDEIVELTPELQVKLLRVMQERQIERLGGSQTIDVDVRVIAATNQNVEKAVASGKLREDFYYRLNVFPIRVPPLRERRDDIPLLVWEFVDQFNETMGKQIKTICAGTMEALQRYYWPGNVRELRNIVERAMIRATETALQIPVPGVPAAEAAPHRPTLREYESDYIRSVLNSNGWRIRGKNGAAEILGLKPSTLESRMSNLKISRNERH
jgi:formate hydrogenlyase transcriptional activator